MNDIRVSLNKLFLDPHNFRLRSHPEYTTYDGLSDEMIVRDTVQNRTTRLVSGPKNSDIIDIIDSVRSNGFLKVDNILVRKLKGDLGYVVIEGNRRVAALKALKKSKDEGYDIGKLNPRIFLEPTGDENHGVDVVEFSYANEEEYLVLMGLRHVSGNKKWDRYNQAKLVAELFEKGFELGKIASKIGLKSAAVAKHMLNTFFVIDEYIGKKELYDFDRDFNAYDKFQIFEQALAQQKLRDWLGWNEKTRKFEKSKNKERFFSWISPGFGLLNGGGENDGEDDDSIGELLEPIIVNHKELRDLAGIVDDPDSLNILEETRSINEAMEQNAGYTKKKFLAALKTAEKTLSNIKIGPTLTMTADDLKVIENIIAIASKLKQE